ncbi:hypothetical protein [Nocardia sp. NBC_01327]|uniref:hypothetical protein n=1 Tax=Nocardia sp. NBC_01327 TaxID=2903593 RepID=UPI002E0E4525|nr:hypothetical protein OG326_21050 [Nocardia sp. NBC_01327]
MAGESVTTLYDFQLSMLFAMCKSAPAPAGKLLDRIGATRQQAEAAEKRWWFTEATNKFSTVDEYISAWGAPASERVEFHLGREVRYAAWDLPFWPGLRMEWMQLPNQPHLFRTLHRGPDCVPPRLASVADLTPWSCTWDEFHDGSLCPTEVFDGFGGRATVACFRGVDPGSGHERI